MQVVKKPTKNLSRMTAFHFRRPPKREITSDSCSACDACMRSCIRSRKGRFCVLFRRIRLTSRRLMVKRVLWFTWRHIFKTSRGRDTAALNFRYAHARERPGAKDNTSPRSCRFPEVVPFGTPWYRQNCTPSRWPFPVLYESDKNFNSFIFEKI